METVRSGFLTKCGHVRKSWKRRWFTLIADGTLAYSEDDSKPQKGSINVGCSACATVPDTRFKRGHVFSVTSTHGETLIMQADSDHDRDAWVSAITNLASETLFYDGVLLFQSGWRKNWKTRYAVLSGSSLAWFEGESSAARVSKPVGVLCLTGANVTWAPESPAPVPASDKAGMPSATLLVVSADGRTTVQLGVASTGDAEPWLQALRASSSGDAASRKAFMEARAIAAATFASPTVPSSSADVAPPSPISLTPSAVCPPVVSPPLLLPEPSPIQLVDVDATATATAALLARIAELEAQRAKESALRADGERVAAAEAARAAQLLAEREAARKRQAELEAELQRRTESEAKAEQLREALSEQRRAEHAASLAAHVAQAREEEQRHAAASLKQHVVTEVQERPREPHTVTSGHTTVLAEQSMATAALLPSNAVDRVEPSVASPIAKPVAASPTDLLRTVHSEADAAIILVEAAAPPVQRNRDVAEGDGTGTASTSGSLPLSEWGAWSSEPDGAERLLMKKRIFEYLLRKTTVGSSPAQATYLETTAVPSVEAVFYQEARGDLARYADPSTIKARLKRVFADKAGGPHTNGTSRGPSTPLLASASPALSHMSDASSAAGRSLTPLPARASPSFHGHAGPGLRSSFAVSDAASGGATPVRPPRPDRARERMIASSPGNSGHIARRDMPRNDSSLSSFATPRMHSPSRGSDASVATLAHSECAASASRASGTSSPYQAGSASTGPRWGAAPHPWGCLRSVVIRHFPAQADGAMRLALVLERRPSEPPTLKELNKWQHRQCADCCSMQTTGLGLLNTGLPAHYCNYTELLFCERCMAAEPRPIPWRIVHNLDESPLPVARVASEYIDRILGAPIVALSALAPRTLARSVPLQQVMQLRARIADIFESVAVGAAEREKDRAGGMGEEPRLSAVSGDDDVSAVPSEAPTPLRQSVESSRAAATAYRDCSRLFRKTVGDRLAFMMDSVELLPLTLIVQIDVTGEERVIPRLVAAARALEHYAASRGFLSPRT